MLEHAYHGFPQLAATIKLQFASSAVIMYVPFMHVQTVQYEYALYHEHIKGPLAHFFLNFYIDNAL